MAAGERGVSPETAALKEHESSTGLTDDLNPGKKLQNQKWEELPAFPGIPSTAPRQPSGVLWGCWWGGGSFHLFPNTHPPFPSGSCWWFQRPTGPEHLRHGNACFLTSPPPLDWQTRLKSLEGYSEESPVPIRKPCERNVGSVWHSTLSDQISKLCLGQASNTEVTKAPSCSLFPHIACNQLRGPSFPLGSPRLSPLHQWERRNFIPRILANCVGLLSEPLSFLEENQILTSVSSPSPLPPPTPTHLLGLKPGRKSPARLDIGEGHWQHGGRGRPGPQEGKPSGDRPCGPWQQGESFLSSLGLAPSPCLSGMRMWVGEFSNLQTIPAEQRRKYAE